MGQKYRILDYQNGKIYSDIGSTKDVCTMIPLLCSYSNSWAIMTHNDQIITSHFSQIHPGEWTYESRVTEYKGE